MRQHAHDEFRFAEPLGQIDWNEEERVAEGVGQVYLRGRAIALPALDAYAPLGIDLIEPPRVRIFELCRYLAATSREQVLGTPNEQRVSIRPEMKQLMQLEEWHHPNVVVGERPSSTRTFQQLARVLETGDVSRYDGPERANTHWRNWPEGGML